MLSGGFGFGVDGIKAYLFGSLVLFGLSMLVSALVYRISVNRASEGWGCLLTRLVLLVLAMFCVVAVINWVCLLKGGILLRLVGIMALV